MRSCNENFGRLVRNNHAGDIIDGYQNQINSTIKNYCVCSDANRDSLGTHIHPHVFTFPQ